MRINDYWNCPTEAHEGTYCCDEIMTVDKSGTCICSTCGRKIKPANDFPEPADIELPSDYFRDNLE